MRTAQNKGVCLASRVLSIGRRRNRCFANEGGSRALQRNLSTTRNKTPAGRGLAGFYSLTASSRVGTLHNVRILFTRSSI
jgi:hypothetical protein